MVKYILKTKYPQSDEIGTIVEKISCGYIKQGCDPNNTECYSFGEIEEYPEFWQKIEEKDYEILAFISINHIHGEEDIDKGTICSRKGNSSYFSNKSEGKIDIEAKEKNLLTNKNWSIYSVKRISDGELFTIGDNLILDKWMKDRKYITIFEIYYNEHKQLSFKINSNLAPKTFVFGLSDINCKRYKEPLFTTEDKVDIYKGDLYFWIDKEYNLYSQDWKIISGKDKDHHYFSTEEAAKEYIYKNKPKYSEKDMLDFGKTIINGYNWSTTVYPSLQEWKFKNNK